MLNHNKLRKDKCYQFSPYHTFEVEFIWFFSYNIKTFLVTNTSLPQLRHRNHSCCSNDDVWILKPVKCSLALVYSIAEYCMVSGFSVPVYIMLTLMLMLYSKIRLISKKLLWAEVDLIDLDNKYSSEHKWNRRKILNSHLIED